MLQLDELDLGNNTTGLIKVRARVKEERGGRMQKRKKFVVQEAGVVLSEEPRSVG